MNDFEWAPHLAKNTVLSETPLIPGSKIVYSKDCNFHFSSGIMKDSKLNLGYFQEGFNKAMDFPAIRNSFALFNLDNLKQRMKILYDKDVKLLLMLVYIPTEDIPVIFKIIILSVFKGLHFSMCMILFRLN